VTFSRPFVKAYVKTPETNNTSVNAAVVAEKSFPKNELAILGLSSAEISVARIVADPAQINGCEKKLIDFDLIFERIKKIAETMIPVTMTNIFTTANNRNVDGAKAKNPRMIVTNKAIKDIFSNRDAKDLGDDSCTVSIKMTYNFL